MSGVKTERVYTDDGTDGVDTVGLAKIEDTGKNICTAWVFCNADATPPTVLASHNVASITRTATGYFDVYFTTEMDNTNYAASFSLDRDMTETYWFAVTAKATTHISVKTIRGNSALPLNYDFSLIIFGGVA